MAKQVHKYAEEVYTVTISRDRLTGVAVFEKWQKDGKIHRENGPAWIRRSPVTGDVIEEAWYKDDREDRTDGPAVIRRKSGTGRVYQSEWYTAGEKISPPKPRRVQRSRSSISQRSLSDGPVR